MRRHIVREGANESSGNATVERIKTLSRQSVEKSVTEKEQRTDLLGTLPLSTTYC